MRLDFFKPSKIVEYTSADAFFQRQHRGLDHNLQAMEFFALANENAGRHAWIVTVEKGELRITRAEVHPLMLLDCNQARLCDLAYAAIEADRKKTPIVIFAGNYNALSKFVESRDARSFVE